MDAKRISDMAESALAAFEDLELSTAAEVAQWTLLKIWRDHTDDLADIVLIEGIERRLNPKLRVEDFDGLDLGKTEAPPLVAL